MAQDHPPAEVGSMEGLGVPCPSEGCANCRFWSEMPLPCQDGEKHPDGSLGDCRRYPPQAAGFLDGETGLQDEWRFPTTRALEWCGEWCAAKRVTPNGTHEP